MGTQSRKTESQWVTFLSVHVRSRAGSREAGEVSKSAWRLGASFSVYPNPVPAQESEGPSTSIYHACVVLAILKIILYFSLGIILYNKKELFV